MPCEVVGKLLSLAAGDQLPAPLAREWAARRISLPAPADLARAMDLGDRYALLDLIALLSSDIFDVIRWGGCGGMKSNELSR